MRRHPPIALDLSWGDLLTALRGCLLPAPPPLEPAGTALVSLCVRSAFDLFLQARALEPGDEVLVGAITHPDMVEILRGHGLEPRAVDLDPGTLAPAWEALEAALSARTRALLVTHLFGGRLDLAPLAAWCAERGIELWEDCAQAFTGQADALGPGSEVAFYSFGPLKTSTSLGGALTWVRQPSVRGAMQSLQQTWPEQPTRAFLSRCLKYALLHLGMQPLVYGLLCALMERQGPGAVEVMRTWLAGFPGDFRLERLRLRPCPALLRMLAYRLGRHRPEKVEARARQGSAVAAALPTAARPGPLMPRQTHWIFPILVEDRDEALRRLRAAGFDGMLGLSNLIALAPAPAAEALLERALIVPVREPERLVPVLQSICGR